MTTLDLSAALKARNEGIALALSHDQVFTATARGLARMLCREKGEITMDDVREACAKMGLVPHHKNCWGTVFHRSEFEPVGLTRSKQVQGHGNLIRVWKLRQHQEGAK